MKKPSPSNKCLGRGPIARKVITSAAHQLQNKVTQLADWRQAKLSAVDFQETVVSQEKLTQYDPLHGLYIYGQNHLSVLIEQLSELPALEKLSDAYARAEDEYLPSGPPMSPLTRSYFSCWGFFDLCTTGAKKESFATVAIDLCSYLAVDAELISLFEAMQSSRMGIFQHEGISENFLFLREFITNKRIKAISPSGYLGQPGEVWFARVMPPPFDHPSIDYSVVFTTPYVLGKLGDGQEFVPFVEPDWLAFFKRNLGKTKMADTEQAYEQLMKYGLNRHYWNEYVFLAYRNHRPDMILLEGIPDRPSSLPHSKEGRARLGL